MIRNTLLICTALIAVCGCSHQPLGVQEPMGEAFRQQLHAQQAEPGYAAPTPVTGLHGRSAEKVFNDYLSGGASACGQSSATESIMQSEQ